MGFEKNGAALFLKMWSEKIEFGRVLTIGRQNIHLDWDDYAKLARRLNRPFHGEVPEYMDEVLLSMGARTVDALDFSAYENAKLIHNLNHPIPIEWHETYDTVFDGGSLEHVFNFPVAIANCMNLVAKGGRFVMVNMANNWCGHGFYQFSPELFFRILSSLNGFSVLEMYLSTLDGRSFRVKDPEEVKGRVQLCNREPIFLLLHARRDNIVPLFQQSPQQSDYVQLWNNKQGASAPHQYRDLKKYRVFRFIAHLRRRLMAQLEIRSRSLSNRTLYTPSDLSI